MENINFNEHSNQTKNIKVCLTDFGLACHKYDKVSVNQLCGSPGFMAPEVFKNEPFNTSSTLQKLILSNKFAYPFDLVERTTFPINYSESCIDLLKKMLDKNSKIRFTAEKCLLHEWFEKDRKIIIHQIFKNQILSQQYPENQYDFNSRLRKESKSLLVVDRPIQSVDMESVEIPEENKKKPILEVVLNESGMIENNNNNSTFQFKNIKKIYQKSKFAKEQKISKVNIQKSGDSLFESENDEDQSNIISNLKFEDMKKQKTDQQILLSNQRNIRNKKATKDNDNEQVYSMENIQTEEVCEDLEEASINSPIFYLDQNCQDNLEQAFTFSNSLQNINNKAQFRRFE
eukprot:403368918